MSCSSATRRAGSSISTSCARASASVRSSSTSSTRTTQLERSSRARRARRFSRPSMRSELRARQRDLVRDGAELYAGWLDEHAGLVSARPAPATALSFPLYAAGLPSEQVADAIRTRASVLVIPGSMMGCDGHFRLTVGFEPAFLGAALERIADVL